MSHQGKGPTIPADRQNEAYTATQWLQTHLDRPLAPNEPQTFGRMAYERYTARHAGRPPYSMRLGPKRSQKTVYLPEDEHMLQQTLNAYQHTDTYHNAQERQ